jgi:hypothetical protein
VLLGSGMFMYMFSTITSEENTVEAGVEPRFDFVTSLTKTYSRLKNDENGK